MIKQFKTENNQKNLSRTVRLALVRGDQGKLAESLPDIRENDSLDAGGLF